MSQSTKWWQVVRQLAAACIKFPSVESSFTSRSVRCSLPLVRWIPRRKHLEKLHCYLTLTFPEHEWLNRGLERHRGRWTPTCEGKLTPWEYQLCSPPLVGRTHGRRLSLSFLRDKSAIKKTTIDVSSWPKMWYNMKQCVCRVRVFLSHLFQSKNY